MVDFSTREGIMKEWDSWVRYYRSGGGGTWPADAFESLLDYFDEQRHLPEASSRPDKPGCICGPFYLNQGTHNSVCPRYK